MGSPSAGRKVDLSCSARAGADWMSCFEFMRISNSKCQPRSWTSSMWMRVELMR